MEKNGCLYREQCPVMSYLRNPAERIYIQIFCEGVYHQCARYVVHQSGQLVPDNLLPYGGTKPASPTTQPG